MFKFTKEDIKKLVEEYPYLLPRNVWTGKVVEDYNYTWLNGFNSIPDGWQLLFLQLCKDIKQPLIDANYLEDFRFGQIKEKFNELRCYHFGAPQEVEEILQKYEVMARLVCTRCGRPAYYETSNYIASYCIDCWKDFVRHKNGDFIEPTFEFETATIKDGKKFVKRISYKDEWERYLEVLKNVKSKQYRDLQR